MAISSFDPRPQNEPLLAEIKAALGNVAESGRFIGGPVVEGFETAFAELVGARHGVAVSSGTDALLVALMAAEVGPGDAVLTTPFTFFGTAGVVARLGARPLFCDIDPVTYNLSVGSAKAALASARGQGLRVAVLMPVHLYGLMADLEPLQELARAEDLLLIEDAAQAVAAASPAGQAGSVGAMGCFSFYPTKNLGAMGEGGIVVTSDSRWADALALLRNHGMEERYIHHRVGGNFRLDALQAAVLHLKLKHLGGWIDERRRLAARYDSGLAAAVRGGELQLPQAPDGYQHVFHQYVVRSPRRDRLKSHLHDRDIGSSIFYPLALHRQPCFADLGYAEGAFPEAERASREVLALPLYPGLSDVDIDTVCAAIVEFFQG
jgi:dTDP-4-amino-4,6-dideoxygalactose transaminase